MKGLLWNAGMIMFALFLIKSKDWSIEASATTEMCAVSAGCPSIFLIDPLIGFDPPACADACLAASPANVYFDINTSLNAHGCYCATSCPVLSILPGSASFASNGAPCGASPYSKAPSAAPTTTAPTVVPSFQPTADPTASPTTIAPSAIPSITPTATPTAIPTISPSAVPSAEPTLKPTTADASSDSDMNMIIGVVVGVGGFILLATLVYYFKGYQLLRGHDKIYVEANKADVITNQNL